MTNLVKSDNRTLTQYDLKSRKVNDAIAEVEAILRINISDENKLQLYSLLTQLVILDSKSKK